MVGVWKSARRNILNDGMMGAFPLCHLCPFEGGDAGKLLVRTNTHFANVNQQTFVIKAC
jgi:hypothetical protein